MFVSSRAPGLRLEQKQSLLSSHSLKTANVSMKLENSIAIANVNSTGKKGMKEFKGREEYD